MSLSGEQQAGELPFTSIPLHKLDEEEWRSLVFDVTNPNIGVCLEFDKLESLELQKAGFFTLSTNGKPMDTTQLVGVTTRAYVDRGGGVNKDVTLIELLGRFDPTVIPTIPDNMVMGTISTQDLTNHLINVFK